MLMRQDGNKIILERGDMLYRYGLEQYYPSVWCNKIHNSKYFFNEHGNKNQIGAYFFYNNEDTARRVLEVAIKKQETQGQRIEAATITSCEVREDIVLLDLFTGIESCSNMISVLRELNLNVVTNSFYNYQKKAYYTKIEHDLELLYSEDYANRLNAAKGIDDFFYNLPPLLGQSLTDFRNGVAFKEMLIRNHWEGYVFKEEERSNTYCLLDATKLTEPRHKLFRRDALL